MELIVGVKYTDVPWRRIGTVSPCGVINAMKSRLMMVRKSCNKKRETLSNGKGNAFTHEKMNTHGMSTAMKFNDALATNNVQSVA